MQPAASGLQDRFSGCSGKEVVRLGTIREFLTEEDGVAVVEVVLILLVLIALVLVFKGQITKILKSILSKAASQSDSV